MNSNYSETHIHQYSRPLFCWLKCNMFVFPRVMFRALSEKNLARMFGEKCGFWCDGARICLFMADGAQNFNTETAIYGAKPPLSARERNNFPRSRGVSPDSLTRVQFSYPGDGICARWNAKFEIALRRRAALYEHTHAPLQNLWSACLDTFVTFSSGY